MRRREFIVLIGGMVIVLPKVAHAQQVNRLWRIAILQEEAAMESGMKARFDAFRIGLGNLGYVEDKNIVFDRRGARGREALVALCHDMIARGANVIVAVSTNTALAAQAATKTVPIVIRTAADPVAAGLVASLARPGGNITGVTSVAPELSAKRLEILRELLPRLNRVAVLWEPEAAIGRAVKGETEAAARALGVEIEGFGVRGADELAGAFQAIAAAHFDAVAVLPGPIVTGNQVRIVALNAESHIPGIYQERPLVEAGGLMSFGPNFERLFQRLAYYVDRILQGAKPADLPVEEPTRFEMIINLRTAKALGLTIPQSILARADEVIE